jgi:dienelactone hydrolase
VSPELVQLCAAAFYGHDVPKSRAAELAEEVRSLVDAAHFDTAMPDFEDAPDRFLAALLAAAKTG